ncbi:neocarzinostatin [Neisseria bacilliformis ATCC BAA-1200]|uniref:Neocarzinostatin n=1 Tax=Neisseria bacilliformis ATCC BAA-1200 TaxID=888742 RepID=F2B9F6_9NEIS|nr:neocarzinostatin [Neisseria bacilliformis ATCC BAA-1200]
MIRIIRGRLKTCFTGFQTASAVKLQVGFSNPTFSAGFPCRAGCRIQVSDIYGLCFQTASEAD